MSDVTIYQKLANIRKQVEIMKKDARAYGYNYVKEEDILAKVTVFMDEYGLSLTPAIVPGTMQVQPYTYKKTRSTKQGAIYEENVNENLVWGEMTYTWRNVDNPTEEITIPWVFVGQQADASQAFGSGLTYTNRYFLLKYFNVSTSDDDPDAWRAKQREAEDAAAKMVAEEIVKVIDETIKDFMREHKEKGPDVKKLCVKYAKDGDYFSIADPVLAQKLLDDFKNTFIKE